MDPEARRWCSRVARLAAAIGIASHLRTAHDAAEGGRRSLTAYQQRFITRPTRARKWLLQRHSHRAMRPRA